MNNLNFKNLRGGLNWIEVSLKANGKITGHLYPEVDGHYYFLPPRSNVGCWAGWVLREIADKLEKLNQ